MKIMTLRIGEALIGLGECSVDPHHHGARRLDVAEFRGFEGRDRSHRRADHTVLGVELGRVLAQPHAHVGNVAGLVGRTRHVRDHLLLGDVGETGRALDEDIGIAPGPPWD
jgi:hypothetical protein